MTVAYPIGAAIIVISFITTLIYVSRANNEFEELEMSIKNDVKGSFIMFKIFAILSLLALGLFAAGDASFEGKRDLNIPAITNVLIIHCWNFRYYKMGS